MWSETVFTARAILPAIASDDFAAVCPKSS
jgi:hypothetical protein